MVSWKKVKEFFKGQRFAVDPNTEDFELLQIKVYKRFKCGDIMEYIICLDSDGKPMMGTSKQLYVTLRPCPVQHDHRRLYQLR